MFTQDELLRIGEGFYYRRNYEYAIKIFSDIIDQNEMHAKAYYWRSFCHLALENFEQKKADFDKAFELDPSDHDILSQKAFIAQNDNDEALLRELVTKIPVASLSTIPLIETFGVIFYEMGLHELSYRLVEGSLDAAHERLQWQNLLALKEYKTAENKLKKMLSLDPYNTEAMVGLGEALYFQREYNKALEYLLNDEIENQFKTAFYYHLLGLVYLKLEKIEKAIESFEDAIRQDASFLLAYKDIAIAHYKNNKRSTAIEYLKKAQTLHYAEFCDDEVDRLLNSI